MVQVGREHQEANKRQSAVYNQSERYKVWDIHCSQPSLWIWQLIDCVDRFVVWFGPLDIWGKYPDFYKLIGTEWVMWSELHWLPSLSQDVSVMVQLLCWFDLAGEANFFFPLCSLRKEPMTTWLAAKPVGNLCYSNPGHCWRQLIYLSQHLTVSDIWWECGWLFQNVGRILFF